MSNAEPKSPLTIIAIFAGIIEASALASLPFLGADSQSLYTWFLVGFPPFLTLLFFLTLNFNSKSLYYPEADDPEAATEPYAEAVPPGSRLEYRPLAPSGASAEDPPLATITLSGAHSRKLVGRLLRQTLSQDDEPLSLVLKDLERGTQTTIITRRLYADPQVG